MSIISARLDGISVLLVDDDGDTLEMLGALLTQHGAEPLVATSVGEALELFETRRPDILVADIGMPYEDGYAGLSIN